MPIDGGMRNKLEAGMVLVAKYKGTEYRADVVAGEGERLIFRFDGRDFKSPSAAGSAVMNGVACNGWRFWSLDADAKPAAKPARAKAAPKAAPKAKAPRKPRAAAAPAVEEDAPAA